jgi:hypothetical protein
MFPYPYTLGFFGSFSTEKIAEKGFFSILPLLYPLIERSCIIYSAVFGNLRNQGEITL